MSETIDASRLAEQLPELLERTQAGESFLVVQNGVHVARLGPYKGSAAQQATGEREASAAG